MKRPHWILHFLYYFLSLVVYIGVYYGIAFLFKRSGHSDDLGAVIVAVYGLMFFVMPLLAIVLIRFSLLRWYVDPFAAAVFPLSLCVLFFVDNFQKHGTFMTALSSVNATLSKGEGEGWLWMLVMFLFGLAVSLSFARPRGESISYKLLAKLFNRKKSS